MGANGTEPHTRGFAAWTVARVCGASASTITAESRGEMRLSTPASVEASGAAGTDLVNVLACAAARNIATVSGDTEWKIRVPSATGSAAATASSVPASPGHESAVATAAGVAAGVDPPDETSDTSAATPALTASRITASAATAISADLLRSGVDGWAMT